MEKISKKQAKKLIDGWEIICKYNEKNPDKAIDKEKFVEAFFEVVSKNDE